MTDRVIITPDLVKASLPSYDVNTAVLDQLALHSDFAFLGDVERGEFTISNANLVINFGRTFAHIPIVACGWTTTGGFTFQSDGSTVNAGLVMIDSFSKVESGTNPKLTAQIEVSKVTLIPQWIGLSYPSGPPPSAAIPTPVTGKFRMLG